MDVSRTKHRTRVRTKATSEARSIQRRGTMASAPALPTETAVTMFAIASGVGGALSQLLAANKLSTTSAESIPLTRLALPVGLSIAGAVVGAALLPGEFDLPSPRRA